MRLHRHGFRRSFPEAEVIIGKALSGKILLRFQVNVLRDFRGKISESKQPAEIGRNRGVSTLTFSADNKLSSSRERVRNLGLTGARSILRCLAESVSIYSEPLQACSFRHPLVSEDLCSISRAYCWHLDASSMGLRLLAQGFLPYRYL